jgi:hypothetical protein
MSGSFPNNQSNPAGATPVWINPVAPGALFTPSAAAASSIAAGGAAITVFTGPIAGGFIQNPLSAAGQGIATAANLYINMIAAPGSTDAAAGGGTITLVPGASYAVPPLAAGVTLRANAATTNHKFTAFKW